MKRRWIVVMLGLRGLATGHRSELSTHRSQESARIAALEALARLREGHAPLGPDYTIVVEHAGEQFFVDGEDGSPVTDPWAQRGRPVRADGPATLDDLLDADGGGGEDEPAQTEATTPEPVPVTPDSATAEAEAEAAPDRDAPVAEAHPPTDAGEPAQEESPVRRRRPQEADTPDGPVPADLLSRWEEKAAAYDEWEARQAQTGDDD